MSTAQTVNPPSVELGFADNPLRSKRQVFIGEEQKEIPVPIELILKGNNLNIYEDVLNRNFFRVFLRANKLIFQAAGFLGLIPINDDVAIEVRARVPIQNLERLLLLTPRYTPEILRDRLRNFGLSSVGVPSLLDLLAYRLLEAVKEIRAEGLHYEYTQREHFSTSPRGRISPFQSVKLQVSTGRRLAVSSSAFERTFDTGPNRCLRLAISYMRSIYRGMGNRKGARGISSQLGLAESYLEVAELDPSLRFLSDRLVSDPRLLPSTKSSYSSALSVAKMVLQNQTIAIRQTGDVLLPSVLINMEDVFEGYFRSVLATHLATNSLTVLDGNLNEPAGAARPLFDNTNHSSKSNRATPDIVIRRLRPKVSNELLIDTKYKLVQNLPDREDINQILAYGLVYQCRRVALAYPRRHASQHTVERLGAVSGIGVFRISIDLGAANLQEEEERFVAAIRLLTQQP